MTGNGSDKIRVTGSSLKLDDIYFAKMETKETGKGMGHNKIVTEEHNEKVDSSTTPSLQRNIANEEVKKSRNGSMEGHKASSGWPTGLKWLGRIINFFRSAKEEKATKEMKQLGSKIEELKGDLGSGYVSKRTGVSELPDFAPPGLGNEEREEKNNEILGFEKQMNDIIETKRQWVRGLKHNLKKAGELLKKALEQLKNKAKGLVKDYCNKFNSAKKDLKVNEDYRDEIAGKPDNIKLLKFQRIALQEKINATVKTIKSKKRIFKRAEKYFKAKDEFIKKLVKKKMEEIKKSADQIERMSKRDDVLKTFFTTIIKDEIAQKKRIELLQSEITNLQEEKTGIEKQLDIESKKLLNTMVEDEKEAERYTDELKKLLYNHPDVYRKNEEDQAEWDMNCVKEELDEKLDNYRQDQEHNVNEAKLHFYKEARIKELGAKLEQRKIEIRQQAIEEKTEELDAKLEQQKIEIIRQTAEKTKELKAKYVDDINKIDAEIAKLEKKIKGLEGSNA